MKRLHTDAELDEISRLYQLIARTTGRFTFTKPVADEDIDTVQAALVEALPEDYTPRVHRGADPRYVEVEVRRDGRGFYDGVMWILVDRAA